MSKEYNQPQVPASAMEEQKVVLPPPHRISKKVQGPFRARIATLNDDGRGVARVAGKVTFIDNALPGEEVAFYIEKRTKTYDRGWASEIYHPSPDRVTPRCRYFGLCGGCSLQHLDSAAQIHEKEQVLRDKFRQFGKLVPEIWLAPLSGPAWGYRRSARLGVRYVEKKGGILVGFREQRSSYITPLQSCEVLDPRVAVLLPFMYEMIGGLSRFERIPQIEIMCGDDTVALVIRHLDPLTIADRAGLVAFAQRHGVRIYSQLKGPESVEIIWPENDTPMAYYLPEYELKFEFRPTNFIQVNAEINRAMVHRAVDLLEVQPNDTVLDLFCGLGNFTLPLARRAAHVTGVEAEAGLLTAARANAVSNGITNCEFRQVDLDDTAQATVFWPHTAFTRMMLDPPRSGALEIIKSMPARQAPRRIVSVSCNPATLARDAEYLINVRGYRLRSAGVMDMFPQTNHVESIAVFTCD